MKRFITNNYLFPTEHPENRRICFLNLLLLSAIFIYSVLCFLEIFFNRFYTYCIIDLVSVFLCLLILVYFHKKNNINVSVILTVSLLLLKFIIFLILDDQQSAIFWLYAFPPILYFLLTNKTANIIAGVYSIFVVTYLIVSAEHPIAEQPFNILLSMFSVVLMFNFFEIISRRVTLALNKKKSQINRANDILKQNQDRLQFIVDFITEAIFGIDLEGNCTFCNKSCVKLLGYEAQEELTNKSILNMIFYNDDNRADKSNRLLKRLKDGKNYYSENQVFWRKNGSSFDVEVNAYPQMEDDKVTGMIVTFYDITKRKKRDRRIYYLSTHDQLTGLYNRRYFNEVLHLIDREKYLPISIVFADVNGLKMINDIFGHSAGDSLIVKSANLLKRNCRKGDIVVRLGGDEFVVLMPNSSNERSQQFIDNVKMSLSELKTSAIDCGLSIGCDTKTDIEKDIESVITSAESNMYKEKTINRKSLNSNVIKSIINNLHKRSPYEKRHSENVSYLCQKVGRALSLNENEIKNLKDAGYLHDIGKIALNEKALKKAEDNEEDKKNLQQHSIVGFRILNMFDEALNLAEAVYSHHERWDGSGYPKGLKKQEIPFVSRVIAVAEEYDHTVYRLNKSKQDALEVIRSLAGTKLDPEISKVFIRVVSNSFNSE